MAAAPQSKLKSSRNLTRTFPVGFNPYSIESITKITDYDTNKIKIIENALKFKKQRLQKYGSMFDKVDRLNEIYGLTVPFIDNSLTLVTGSKSDVLSVKTYDSGVWTTNEKGEEHFFHCFLLKKEFVDNHIVLDNRLKGIPVNYGVIQSEGLQELEIIENGCQTIIRKNDELDYSDEESTELQSKLDTLIRRNKIFDVSGNYTELLTIIQHCVGCGHIDYPLINTTKVTIPDNFTDRLEEEIETESNTLVSIIYHRGCIRALGESGMKSSMTDVFYEKYERLGLYFSMKIEPTGQILVGFSDKGNIDTSDLTKYIEIPSDSGSDSDANNTNDPFGSEYSNFTSMGNNNKTKNNRNKKGRYKGSVISEEKESENDNSKTKSKSKGKGKGKGKGGRVGKRTKSKSKTKTNTNKKSKSKTKTKPTVEDDIEISDIF